MIRKLFTSKLLVRSSILFGGGAVAAYNLKDSDLARPLTFWRSMFPIYLEYRYTQWRNKGLSDEELDKLYEQLHLKNAPIILELILRLRGFYVKIGQVGASREDLLPEIYRDHLRVLFDKVPALSSGEARAIVENALGKNIDDVFTEFEDEPLGAASIGQVHKAKLKNGKQVVVKIKYPNAYDLFQQDLSTMRRFVKLAQPEQLIIFDELEKQFMTEFDFSNEAHALAEIRGNIMPHYPSVAIPAPLMDYCNKDILVMEYLPGRKLIDVVLENYKNIASTMGMTLEQLTRSYKQNPSQTIPFHITWHLTIQYISKQAHYASALLYNFTLGWFLAPMKYPLAVNPKKILQTLLDVHAHEIFIDGYFNGDPHPGNILLLDDGRIGLIDYGQVKRITVEDRRNLAEFLLAIGRDNKDEIVDKMVRMGMETEKGNKEIMYRTGRLVFDRDDPEALGGKNFQQTMEDFDRIDRTKKIPDQFVFVVRVCMLLRGLGRLLKEPPVSIATVWKPYAERALKELPEVNV